MWFEFIIFELHLLGEASLGLSAHKVLAGDPNLSGAKRPAPSCLYSCQKDYVDGNKEGKMREGLGPDSGGQGSGCASLMGQRLGPRSPEALGLLGGIGSLESEIRSGGT